LTKYFLKGHEPVVSGTEIAKQALAHRNAGTLGNVHKNTAVLIKALECIASFRGARAQIF
jgi:hypothetical protein